MKPRNKEAADQFLLICEQNKLSHEQMLEILDPKSFSHLRPDRYGFPEVDGQAVKRIILSRIKRKSPN